MKGTDAARLPLRVLLPMRCPGNAAVRQALLARLSSRFFRQQRDRFALGRVGVNADIDDLGLRHL